MISAVVDYPGFQRSIQRLDSKYHQVPIYLSRTNPVMGTHTGPGLIIAPLLGDKQFTT
jgi:fatty acid-binding protein DegV